METPNVVKRICASFLYECLDLYKKEDDAVNWAMDEIKEHETKELKSFLDMVFSNTFPSIILNQIWNESGSQIGIQDGDFALNIFQGVRARITKI